MALKLKIRTKYMQRIEDRLLTLQEKFKNSYMGTAGNICYKLDSKNPELIWILIDFAGSNKLTNVPMLRKFRQRIHLIDSEAEVEVL
jgi:hypothetical protein